MKILSIVILSSRSLNVIAGLQAASLLEIFNWCWLVNPNHHSGPLDNIRQYKELGN